MAAEVLIVEDERIVAKDTQRMLKELGYAAPHIVSSGEEALGHVAESPPNLVLMDINLRGKMDGVQAAEQIRARFNLPVIYLTAYADYDTLQRAKITEPFGYILKPFEERELQTTIEMALYKHATEEALRESEARWRALTETASQAIVSADSNGLITSWNAAAQQTFLFGAAEVIGQPIMMLMPERYRPLLQQGMERVRYGSDPHVMGATIELAGVRKDRIEFPLELSLAAWETKQGKFYSAIIRDISDRKSAEAALRESNQFNKEIISNAAEGVIVYDRSLRYVVWNRFMQELTGLGEARVIGQYALDIFPHMREEGVYQLLEKALTGETATSGDVPYRVPVTGKTGWVSGTYAPHRNAAGDIVGVIGVVREVTERKLSEELLRQQNEYMTALHDTTLGLVSRLNLDELLQAIITRAGALVGTDHGYVFLREPNAGEMQMRVGTGLYDDLVGTRTKPGSGLAGIVWQSGEGLAVDDYQTWPSRLPGARRDTLRAVVGVPLKHARSAEASAGAGGAGAEVVGVIGLAHTDAAKKFGANELDVLNRFAALASIALDNARLYSETEEQSLRLAQLNEEIQAALQQAENLYKASSRVASSNTLQEIVAAVIEGVGVPAINRGVLVLFERDANQDVQAMDVRANWHGGTGTAPTATGTHYPKAIFAALSLILSPTPVFFDDLHHDERVDPATRGIMERQNIRSMAVLPLWIGPRQLGALLLESEEVYHFVENEIRPFVSLAQQMAITIENKHLLEATQQQLSELATLNNISQTISSQLDLHSLIQLVGEQVAQSFGVQNAYVGLYHRDTNVIEIPYMLEGGYLTSVEPFPLGEGLSSIVIRSRQPLLLNQNTEQRAAELGAKSVGKPAKSYLAVPIILADEVIGIISVQSTEQEGMFDEASTRLLATIAANVSVAIQNAQLYSTVQQELTERMRAEEQARRSQEFLDSVVENIPNMVFVKDATELRWVRFNKAGEELLGFPREDLVGKNDYDFFPKEEAAFFQSKDREVLTAGQMLDISEEPIDTRLQGKRYLHTKKIPIYDDNGKPQYLLGISEDITERKRAEEQLHFQKALLQSQNEASIDGILVVSSDGKNILSFNRRFAEMWDIPDEALATQSVDAARQAVVDQVADPQAWMARVAYHYQHPSEESREEFLLKDGRVFDRYTAPIKGADGTIFARAWYFRDVTDRKRAEEALRRQNVYLATLHDTTVGMMSRLDLTDLLEAIISRAGALVGTPNGYIFLLEPGESEMEMRIGVGTYNGFVGTRAKRGVGLAGQVWETGEPISVDDYRNWPGRLASPSRDILRAVAGVPLKSGSQVVGVIGLAYLEEGQRFGEDEMVVLNRFAQLASIALDNSRLYTDLQHQREHLQLANQAGQLLTAEMSVSGVLDAALGLAPHLDAEHSYVLVLEPGDKTNFKGTVPGLANLDDEAASAFGRAIATRGLEKWILENRQPALVNDSRTDPRWYTAPQHEAEEPARAVVAVPIFGPRSEISGVLAYTHPTPGHFNEEEVQLVELIGQYLATALDNARLFEQTQAALADRQRAEDERFAIERKLLETQKLESLGVLAGGIAHDFNNLLVSILGNVGLALLDLEPLSPVREPVEQIKVAAQRAAELTRQMLAYSGKGRFVVQRLNLNSIIDEMTQLLKVSISKNAILKLNLSPRIPAIEGDATQVRQIVMNLIVNASDAIGNKEGIITLSTGVVRADRLYLSQAFLAPDLPEGDYAYVEIADSGVGMDQETLAKIFDPFFTTKFTGRGLGLAAVLGIVRGHKGAILVYSEPGRGSTFRILLPSVEAPVESRSDDNGDGANHGSGTILVVDDEEIVRKVTRRMLERYGYNVLVAEDGRRAIDLYHANPAAVDCVLLDMTMPGLGGDETFRELRRIKPDAVVVLMSGYTEQDATSRFSGKGLAGFLQKPYTPQDLREKISSVMQNGNGQPKT